MDDGDFLHAINGDWDALLALMRANRQVAQRTDASGMTILHWVCLHQDAPTDIVVKVVFAYPYAVHVRNDAGHLPIELAIQAECSERTLEVLRAAANGSRRRSEDNNGRTLDRQDLRGMTKDERGDFNRETIDYPLSFEHHHRMTEDGSESREGSEYQPHQTQTYFGAIDDDDEEEDDEDDDVDADELEYQQRHCHYQSHSFQSQSLLHKNRRLEHSVSDQEELRFDPLQANYNTTSMYGGYVLDAARERNRDRGYTLSRSDPHVKSLLTEQRLRERENDLISIATAEDSVPLGLGLFDPSKGPAETTSMSKFIVQEEAKTNRGNGNISSRSLGTGPRSKMAFPPRWKQSRMCHVCACGFSLVKRRHHCRNCGQSVCSQHSINRVSLPKFALSEPQRVCDQCFLSGHHIMVSSEQTGTPSIAGSIQSLPAQLQREELQHPFHTSQPY